MPSGVTIYDGVWDGSGDVGSLTAISKKAVDKLFKWCGSLTPSSSNAGGVTIVVEKGSGLDYSAILQHFKVLGGLYYVRLKIFRCCRCNSNYTNTDDGEVN